MTGPIATWTLVAGDAMSTVASVARLPSPTGSPQPRPPRPTAPGPPAAANAANESPPSRYSPTAVATNLLSKVRAQQPTSPNQHVATTSPTPTIPKRAPASPSSPSRSPSNGHPGVASTAARDDISRGSPSPPPNEEHSSDPAGSEASDNEDLDFSSDLRRVKVCQLYFHVSHACLPNFIPQVYELIDLQWEDRGTAFCTGDFDENAQEAKIVAKAEGDPNKVLLQHTIRGLDVYQRQQGLPRVFCAAIAAFRSDS